VDAQRNLQLFCLCSLFFVLAFVFAYHSPATVRPLPHGSFRAIATSFCGVRRLDAALFLPSISNLKFPFPACPSVQVAIKETLARAFVVRPLRAC